MKTKYENKVMSEGISEINVMCVWKWKQASKKQLAKMKETEMAK